MQIRRETIPFPIKEKFRILHISDVHFSRRTTHEKNTRVMQEILDACQECGRLDAICVTGDLVSRHCSEESIADALRLMEKLRKCAPVLYSLGNHEMDWEPKALHGLLRNLQEYGITVLDNASTELSGIRFTGVTLPQTVYKNPKGHYWDLEPVTPAMLRDCIGEKGDTPTVLLAHTPLGLSAYALWGAQIVLSGHVHGGIVRVGNVGLLSPERRFLPLYTKGLYTEGTCTMNVSAGIGKFRVNNPAEVVCIDLISGE